MGNKETGIINISKWDWCENLYPGITDNTSESCDTETMSLQLSPHQAKKIRQENCILSYKTEDGFMMYYPVVAYQDRTKHVHVENPNIKLPKGHSVFVVWVRCPIEDF
jgi:hypothetical protein